MHHGQSRGGNTRKVCKKLLNFLKTGGEIFETGGNYKFSRIGGKCSKTGKIGGNPKFVGDDLKKEKKVVRNFWRMKMGNFFGKRENFRNFPESTKFF